MRTFDGSLATTMGHFLGCFRRQLGTSLCEGGGARIQDQGAAEHEFVCADTEHMRTVGIVRVDQALVLECLHCRIPIKESNALLSQTGKSHLCLVSVFVPSIHSLGTSQPAVNHWALPIC